MKEEHKELLCLLKKAIATEDNGEPITITDWGNVYRNATKQSVAAIIFDLLERKGGNVVLPKRLMVEWLGQSLFQKSIYEQYVQAISKLASFYATQHIQMLLLKGYGLSLNYPKPELRNVGDIDIYLFGEKEFGDNMVEREPNIPVNRTLSIPISLTRGLLWRTMASFLIMRSTRAMAVLNCVLRSYWTRMEET